MENEVRQCSNCQNSFPEDEFKSHYITCIIEQDPLETSAAWCQGFAESTIFSIKEYFYQEDLNRMLIMKDGAGAVKYYARDCMVQTGQKPACSKCEILLSSLVQSEGNTKILIVKFELIK